MRVGVEEKIKEEEGGLGKSRTRGRSTGPRPRERNRCRKRRRSRRGGGWEDGLEMAERKERSGQLVSITE